MSWKTISFRKRMLIIMTLSGLIELLILVAAGFTYLKFDQEQEMGEKAWASHVSCLLRTLC